MFASVVYRDMSCWSNGSKSIDQYGFRFVSESKEECVKYVKEHYNEFLDWDGYACPVVVEFDWDDIPATYDYWKKCPGLHICYYKDSDFLVNRIVVRKISEDT